MAVFRNRRPQTAQDAPWLHGPSLKKIFFENPGLLSGVRVSVPAVLAYLVCFGAGMQGRPQRTRVGGFRGSCDPLTVTNSQG